jgi:predicted enzyme related to lactoylglutathione lyase
LFNGLVAQRIEQRRPKALMLVQFQPRSPKKFKIFLNMNLDSAVFYSNDIGRVIKFYRDVLGFVVEYQQGDKYVSFIFPNNARLGIKKKIEEREIPGAQTVFISMDKGIESWYEMLKSKGVQIYKELIIQDWGKNFSILDPDNNKVQFVEKTANI